MELSLEKARSAAGSIAFLGSSSMNLSLLHSLTFSFPQTKQLGTQKSLVTNLLLYGFYLNCYLFILEKCYCVILLNFFQFLCIFFCLYIYLTASLFVNCFTAIDSLFLITFDLYYWCFYAIHVSCNYISTSLKLYQ